MALAGEVMGAAGTDYTPIVVGLLALISAVAVAVIGARGTFRTADSARENAFDQRVDALLARAEQERVEADQKCEAATQEMHRYRELYVRLRVAVLEAGLDPDNLPKRGAADGPA